MKFNNLMMMAMVIKSHRRERNTKLKTKVFSLIALLKIPPTQCVVTHIAQTGFKDFALERLFDGSEKSFRAHTQFPSLSLELLASDEETFFKSVYTRGIKNKYFLSANI